MSEVHGRPVRRRAPAEVGLRDVGRESPGHGRLNIGAVSARYEDAACWR